MSVLVDRLLFYRNFFHFLESSAGSKIKKVYFLSNFYRRKTIKAQISISKIKKEFYYLVEAFFLERLSREKKLGNRIQNTLLV